MQKYLSKVTALVTTVGSFGFAALVLLPFAVYQWPAVNPSLLGWFSVLNLAVLIIPNVYYFRLLLRVGPVKAMAVAFLIPVFGMLWGGIFLGEQVTGGMVGGCGIILLGTALVFGSRRPGS